MCQMKNMLGIDAYGVRHKVKRNVEALLSRGQSPFAARFLGLTWRRATPAEERVISPRFGAIITVASFDSTLQQKQGVVGRLFAPLS